MQSTESLARAGSHSESPACGWDRWLVQGLFYAGLLAYVWLLIQPRLIYDAFGIYLPYPEFVLDGIWLQQAVTRPGGFVEVSAAFLSQWFFAPHLGALIVTAIAALIGFGTQRLLQELGGAASREARHGWFVSLFPALSVLVFYQFYYHPLAALLALAICLWVAVVHQMVANSWRPVAFAAFCVGLYHLAGTVCLLFGLLSGIWYVAGKRRPIAGAVAIAFSVLAPWLAGVQLFHLTVLEAYSVAWPFGTGNASDMEAWPLNALRCLFLFPPGLLLIAVFCRSLPPPLQVRCAGWSRCGGRIVRVMWQLVVLAAAVAAVLSFSRALHRERRFEMVHFALQQQWDQVLRVARQLSPSRHDWFSRHLVNRALYHTGQLGDAQFSFSQTPAALLLLADEVPHGAPKFWMLSEIAWELGDVNLAEQWTFQRLEALGECPSALERLAQICLAKDRTAEASQAGEPLANSAGVRERLADVSSPGREAARILLNRMAKNVLYGHRARALLERLDAPSPAGDSWLQDVERVRVLRCSDDRVFQTYSEEFMLGSLLRANPRNRMAFEYLMAFYLACCRTDKLVEHLPRLNDFGYREIPRHYEEAILIHTNETSQAVALGGRKIRPETVRHFRRFIDRLLPWQQQPPLAVGALADEFGGSYFYYYAFGISGTGGARRSPAAQGPGCGVLVDGGAHTGGRR